MSRPFVHGRPWNGAAGVSFVPGHWRADKPGKVAIPEGPAQPVEPTPFEGDGRMGGSARDPRTAARMADIEQALKPRRWTP